MYFLEKIHLKTFNYCVKLESDNNFIKKICGCVAENVTEKYFQDKKPNSL